MGQGSFAERVRKVFLTAPAREWTAATLAEKLDLVGGEDKNPLYSAVKDMIKAGEVKKIRPGVYLWANRGDEMQIREKIWRAIRKLGKFSIADLEEMTKARPSYAKEIMAAYARQGVVKRISKKGVPGVYRLVNDVVEMPEDSAKKDKLREIRRQKKLGAMRCIKNARQALVDAEAAIMEGWDE